MADRKTPNDELFVPYGYESMKKMAKAAFDDARPFSKQAHQIKNLMNPQLARTLQQFAEPMMGFGKPLERKPIISKPARNEPINEESIRRIICEETGNARRRDIARKAILDVTHSKPDQQADLGTATNKHKKETAFEKKCKSFGIWLEGITEKNSLTKESIEKALIEHDRNLWCSGFTDFWKAQNFVKGVRGTTKLTWL